MRANAPLVFSVYALKSANSPRRVGISIPMMIGPKISAATLGLFLAACAPTAFAHPQDDARTHDDYNRDNRTAKENMKHAGHETKNAAKDAGHGVKEGTKDAYNGTKHGVKKGAGKTKNTVTGAAHGAKEGAKEPVDPR
jgi:hypothetical protein